MLRLTQQKTVERLIQLADELWRSERPDPTMEEAQAQFDDALAALEAAENWSEAEWVAALERHQTEASEQAAIALGKLAELGELHIACLNTRSHYSPAVSLYDDLGKLATFIMWEIREATPASIVPERPSVGDFKRDYTRLLTERVATCREQLARLKEHWRQYQADQARLKHVSDVLSESAPSPRS